MLVPVNQQGDQQGLAEHVRVQQAPEEHVQPAGRGLEQLDLFLLDIICSCLQQDVELGGCPVPADGGEDALYAEAEDREADGRQHPGHDWMVGDWVKQQLIYILLIRDLQN